VVSLLEAVGSVVEHRDGKVAVTLGSETEFFDPPPHKDIDTQTVVNLRRTLEAAIPVARHLRVEAADVAQQRLAGHAVTAVARSAPGRVVLYVDRVDTATDILPLCASSWLTP
jgi:hypothetical protein